MRHFDPEFGGTKILNLEPNEFESILNAELIKIQDSGADSLINKVHDGYAPFCKLVAIENFTDAKVGCVPITESNYIYIRHGFSARREGEFDVFSRWLELPVSAPKANYLMVVLYDKEQIDKEAIAEYNKKLASGGVDSIGLEKPMPFDGDWGVVAILGQNGSDEEPMKPATFDRNYMPIEFGGSGLKYPVMPVPPRDPQANIQEAEAYREELAKYQSEMEEIRINRKRSVDFWKNHVTVK
jgi:hypothetical protein